MQAMKILLVSLLASSGPAVAQTIPSFLRALPQRPQVRVGAYPSCKDDWRKEEGRVAQFTAIQDCIDRLERYNSSELKDFPRRVRAYDRRINIAYANFNKPVHPNWARSAFLAHVQGERDCFRSIDDLGNYGRCYSDYYGMLDRYRGDSNLLIRLREIKRRSQ